MCLEARRISAEIDDRGSMSVKERNENGEKEDEVNENVVSREEEMHRFVGRHWNAGDCANYSRTETTGDP